MASCPSSRCRELFVAKTSAGEVTGISLQHLAGLSLPPPRSIPARLLHLPGPTCPAGRGAHARTGDSERATWIRNQRSKSVNACKHWSLQFLSQTLRVDIRQLVNTLYPHRLSSVTPHPVRPDWIARRWEGPEHTADSLHWLLFSVVCRALILWLLADCKTDVLSTKGNYSYETFCVSE